MYDSATNLLTRRLKPAATMFVMLLAAAIPLSGMRAICHSLLTVTIPCIVLSVTSPVFSQEVQIADGVRIVHNKEPVWDDESKVRLEFVQKIGGIDAVDENYILFGIAGVALDDSIPSIPEAIPIRSGGPA